MTHLEVQKNNVAPTVEGKLNSTTNLGDFGESETNSKQQMNVTHLVSVSVFL